MSSAPKRLTNKITFALGYLDRIEAEMLEVEDFVETTKSGFFRVAS
jgi:hypothetical protein